MSAPPVVLVHGFATSSASTWGENGWLDLLADAGRETVPIDILGHGTADKPHDPAAYADLEGYVADRMPDGPVDAIGFSMGARLLLGVAIREPQRFRRIVTLGVGRNLFESSGSDVIVRAIEGGGDPTNPAADYFARLTAQPGVDKEALLACMKAPVQLLTASACAGVTVPVLVVIGDRDFAGPGDPLADALPDAKLTVLRGADHFSTPKDFGAIDATLRFLED